MEFEAGANVAVRRIGRAGPYSIRNFGASLRWLLRLFHRARRTGQAPALAFREKMVSDFRVGAARCGGH